MVENVRKKSKFSFKKEVFENNAYFRYSWETQCSGGEIGRLATLRW